MTNVILDKQQHKSLKVLSNVEVLAENVNTMPVLADELRQLVLEFPVCIIKHPKTGQLSMQALLGLEAGENLILQKGQWNGNYKPMHLLRQPFMVGIRGEENEAPSDQNTVITIDQSSPLLSEQGEALFAEDGSPTPFLKQKSQIAFSLVSAMKRTEDFLAALDELELIESISLTVTLADGEQKNIEGIYSINEQKLAQLSAEQLALFHERGYLSACHYLLASIGNVQKLVVLKNAIA